MADHLGRADQKVEARGCHAPRQRLHRDQYLGDEMGQALDHRRLTVMRLGCRHDHLEAKHAAQEGGDAPGAGAADRADRDLEPGNAVTAALRAEERMGADDLDVTRQLGEHGRGRADLDRADIDDDRAATQMRPQGRDRFRERRDRHGQDDDVTGGDLGRIGGDDAAGGGVCRQCRVEGQQAAMRLEVTGDQATEGAEAHQADGGIGGVRDKHRVFLGRGRDAG